jgi:hypothetical protein
MTPERRERLAGGQRNLRYFFLAKGRSAEPEPRLRLVPHGVRPEPQGMLHRWTRLIIAPVASMSASMPRLPGRELRTSDRGDRTRSGRRRGGERAARAAGRRCRAGGRGARGKRGVSELSAYRLAAALGSPFADLVPPCVVRVVPEVDADAPGSLMGSASTTATATSFCTCARGGATSGVLRRTHRQPGPEPLQRAVRGGACRTGADRPWLRIRARA